MAQTVYVQDPSRKGDAVVAISKSSPASAPKGETLNGITIFTIEGDPFNEVWKAMRKTQETETDQQVQQINTMEMDSKFTANISADYYGGTWYYAGTDATGNIPQGISNVGAAQAKLQEDANAKKPNSGQINVDNQAVSQQSNLASLYTGQGQSLTDAASQAGQTSASDLAAVTNVASGFASTNKAVTSLLQGQQTS